ncbi:DUF4282 domain-containing protein [Leifsonia sp. AG29]|uniref:DUF4282 domain-containing protein n=1 Tax=Leifsonia sp. AG29 TaxID=2598860 RepID=UPI00131ECA9D|nr:DUF4282 domain-containing protein [Leifsonia sp. AG29]
MTTAPPPSDGEHPAAGAPDGAASSWPEDERPEPAPSAATTEPSAASPAPRKRAAAGTRTAGGASSTSKSPTSKSPTPKTPAAKTPAAKTPAAKTSRTTPSAAKGTTAGRTRRTTTKPPTIDPVGEAPDIMDATLGARTPLAGEATPAPADTSTSPAEPLPTEPTGSEEPTRTLPYPKGLGAVEAAGTVIPAADATGPAVPSSAPARASAPALHRDPDSVATTVLPESRDAQAASERAAQADFGGNAALPAEAQTGPEATSTDGSPARQTWHRFTRWFLSTPGDASEGRGGDVASTPAEPAQQEPAPTTEGPTMTANAGSATPTPETAPPTPETAPPTPTPTPETAPPIPGGPRDGGPHAGYTVNQLADRLDDSRFFSALFDVTFTNYVTRKLAGPVYIVGLVLIGLGIIVGFGNWLSAAITTHSPAGAFVFLFGVLVTVVAAILAVLLLRVGIEVFCAIIEIAQNTRRRPPRG